MPGSEGTYVGGNVHVNIWIVHVKLVFGYHYRFKPVIMSKGNGWVNRMARWCTVVIKCVEVVGCFQGFEVEHIVVVDVFGFDFLSLEAGSDLLASP